MVTALSLVAMQSGRAISADMTPPDTHKAVTSTLLYICHYSTLNKWVGLTKVTHVGFTPPSDPAKSDDVEEGSFLLTFFVPEAV